MSQGKSSWSGIQIKLSLPLTGANKHKLANSQRQAQSSKNSNQNSTQSGNKLPQDLNSGQC